MLSRNFASSILAALVLSTGGGLASAQVQTDGKAAATVRASSIGGLGFAMPAVRSASNDLKEIMLYVAAGLNLECSRTEAFTWPHIVPESEQGKAIFLSIIEALEVKGYQYVLRDLPDPKDEVLAKVQREMRAYSSESADRYARDRHILTVWYREPDEVHLMVCTATDKKPPKVEE